MDAWIKARELTALVYKLTKNFRFSKDFSLRDQIRRAAISTMSNIAEGFDSGSNQYFIQFLSYSRRSASEVQSQLYVALDNEYITEGEFENTYDKAQAARKICVGLIRYLKTRNSQPETRYFRKERR